MNPNLQFDFTVNKETNTIHVTRQFAATLPLVWDCWTKAELLDLWWAPKPYRTVTKYQDFREGGYWLYAMFSPEDVAHWCRADYQKIEPQKSYAGLDAFCDEEGNPSGDIGRTHWLVEFTPKGDTTVVTITNTFNQLSDLEKHIEMGFKEGFSMAMENLDQYLAEQK